MKKHPILRTSVFLLSLFLASCSAKTIHFNCTLLSDREYVQTTTSDSKNEILFAGEKEFMESVLRNNPENPQIVESTSTIGSVIRTQKGANGSIPLTIEYVDPATDDPDGLIQKGDTFYGSFLQDNGLKIDSASAESLSQEKRDMFFQILEMGYETLLFDGGQMKIGDTLVTNVPMIIPFSGQQFELIIVTTYTLKEIKETVALFDVLQEATLTNDLERGKFSAIGTGSGECTYSIDQQYIIENNARFDLDMKFHYGESMKIDMKSTSISKIVTEITSTF
jgi:hypothetical protein